MRKAFTIACFSICFLTLSGQCPDSEVLYKRILNLRDSSKVSSDEQLTELLTYLEKENGCQYKNDSVHTLLLQRIGWLLILQNDFTRGIQYTRQSIDLVYARFNSSSINSELLIQSYINLMLGYDSLHQQAKKQEARDSCIAVSLRLRKGYDNAIFLLYLNVIDLFEKGEYYKCMQDSELGETISKANKNKFEYSDYYIENFLVWKLNALVYMKKTDEAAILITKQIDECKKTNNVTSLGSLYGLMASIAKDKGDFNESLDYYKKCFYYNKKIKNTNGCAQALNNIGFNLYTVLQSRPEIALKYYRLALLYANKAESLNIFDNIANIYVGKEKSDSAIYFYQRAFDNIQPGMNEEKLLNFPLDNLSVNVDYILNLLLDKPEVYIKKFKRDGDTHALNIAIHIYHLTDQFFSRINALQSDIHTKLFWREDLRRLYKKAIEASFLANNAADAFYFFEKARSTLLNEQLQLQRQSNETDLLNLAQSRRKISLLETKLFQTPSTSIQQSVLQQEIFLEKQELSRIVKVIKDKNPVYFQAFVDSSFVTFAAVSNHLSLNKKTLLELFNGDSTVFSLLLTGGKTFLRKIPKTLFDSVARKYTFYLSHPDVLNGNFSDFVKISSSLYQLVFGNHFQGGGSIIISPDGHYFPFESLITSRASGPVSYFIEKHAVSYTYSARFLGTPFHSDAITAGKNFIGIAPVHFTTTFSLASLIGSDKSLKIIDNYFNNATNLVFANASRRNFLHQFTDYKIIQLYAHASETSKNNEPVIYFADSLLYLSDLISETRPLTKLIVLSACETGLGTDYKGEGVFSFNRGFAALGIPSSVTNLWTIDNESTYKITELFYKYVADGLQLDEALQRAKIDFIKTASKEKQLPYYWAASILVGRTDAIPIQKNRNWLLYTLVAGVPVLLLIFFVAIRRKKTTRVPDTTETVS